MAQNVRAKSVMLSIPEPATFMRTLDGKRSSKLATTADLKSSTLTSIPDDVLGASPGVSVGRLSTWSKSPKLIWEPLPDGTKKIKCGSLPNLLEHMYVQKELDEGLLSAVVMSMSLFSSPLQFLELVWLTAKDATFKEPESVIKASVLRMFSIISHWAALRFADFDVTLSRMLTVVLTWSNHLSLVTFRTEPGESVPPVAESFATPRSDPNPRGIWSDTFREDIFCAKCTFHFDKHAIYSFQILTQRLFDLIAHFVARELADKKEAKKNGISLKKSALTFPAAPFAIFVERTTALTPRDCGLLLDLFTRRSYLTLKSPGIYKLTHTSTISLSETLLRQKKSTPATCLAEISPSKLARHLTARAFSLFRRIPPRALLGAGWTKDDARARVPDVMAMIDEMNFLSYLSASTVLAETDKKARLRMIGFWVEVAETCEGLGNYSTIMALIGGLSLNAVSRLRATWAEVEKKERKTHAAFERLSGLVSGVGNYAEYRKVLRVTNPPGVPSLAVLCKDAFFIEESNKIVIDERDEMEMLNVDMLHMLGTVLVQKARFSSVPYPFEENRLLQGVIDSIEIWRNDDKLYQKSIIIEESRRSSMMMSKSESEMQMALLQQQQAATSQQTMPSQSPVPSQPAAPPSE